MAPADSIQLHGTQEIRLPKQRGGRPVAMLGGNLPRPAQGHNFASHGLWKLCSEWTLIKGDLFNLLARDGNMLGRLAMSVQSCRFSHVFARINQQPVCFPEIRCHLSLIIWRHPPRFEPQDLALHMFS